VLIRHLPGLLVANPCFYRCLLTGVHEGSAIVGRHDQVVDYRSDLYRTTGTWAFWLCQPKLGTNWHGMGEKIPSLPKGHLDAVWQPSLEKHFRLVTMSAGGDLPFYLQKLDVITGGSEVLSILRAPVTGISLPIPAVVSSTFQKHFYSCL